ncbi:GNAT family N-acetyltransferase [Actinomadura sediminis]|uniref:GNAT family N-acetyltransferase n=1 Tax=Actinomadura sediminis TaxID=1038904 RepID=A0ABW3ER24_9ACTN
MDVPEVVQPSMGERRRIVLVAPGDQRWAPGSVACVSDAAIGAFVAGQADARRVTLRHLAGCDRTEFIGLVSDSKELHEPWISLPSGPEEFQAYLDRYERPGEEAVLVCLRGSGRIAGVVNINSIIRGRLQSGSVAYAAFAHAAGQGYMTEGLGLVVRYAFEELRLHRLEAQIQPENHASLRLVRRVGFRYEGYSPELLFIDGAWRDHERWAITNSMIDVFPAAPHATLPER